MAFSFSFYLFKTDNKNNSTIENAFFTLKKPIVFVKTLVAILFQTHKLRVDICFKQKKNYNG